MRNRRRSDNNGGRIEYDTCHEVKKTCYAGSECNVDEVLVTGLRCTTVVVE